MPILRITGKLTFLEWKKRLAFIILKKSLTVNVKSSSVGVLDVFSETAKPTLTFDKNKESMWNISSTRTTLLQSRLRQPPLFPLFS